MQDKFDIEILEIINQKKPLTEEAKQQIIAAISAALNQPQDALETDSANESSDRKLPDRDR